MKNDPKHMNADDVEILAYHTLRGTPLLSNRNIDCFIQGYKACNDVLVHSFGQFLEREGEYYKDGYIQKRKEVCGYSGQPITEKHLAEFDAAKKVGELLLQAAKLIKQHNILN